MNNSDSAFSEKPISNTSLTFVWRDNEDDIVEVRRYFDRLILGWLPPWPVSLVVLTLAAAGVWWTYAWGSVLGAAFFCLVFISYLAITLIPFINRLMARNYYRRHPENFVETRAALYIDRVEIQNVFTNVTYSWDALRAVFDTPKGLLFCGPARTAMLWLPARVVDRTSSPPELAESVVESGGQVPQPSLRDQVLDLASKNGLRIRQWS